MQSSDLSFFDALRAGTLSFAYGIPPWAFVALSLGIVGSCGWGMPIQLGLLLPAGEPD